MSSGQNGKLLITIDFSTIMKKKKYLNRVFRLILLISIIFFSVYIKDKVKEQFPSVEIESRSMPFSLNNNTIINSSKSNEKNVYLIDVGQSELHKYCPKEYKNSFSEVYYLKILDLSVKDDDLIMLQSDSKSSESNVIYFAGIQKDNLKRLHEGLEDLELVHYKKTDIPIYYVICFNQYEVSKHSRNHIGFSAKSPSFVYNWAVSFIIFLTTFVLLSQFIEQIMKIFE